MKKILTTIGCLAFATLLALAQADSGPNNIGAAGAGAQPYPGQNPAFGTSGGSGHGVGINGGTHTGSVIGSPYGAAGAQNTNSIRGRTNAAGVQQNQPNSLKPNAPPHSP